MAPQGKRLLSSLREPEVDDAAEELLHARIAIGREKFLGSHQSQGIFKILGHHVLSALPAIKRQHHRARTLPS